VIQSVLVEDEASIASFVALYLKNHAHGRPMISAGY
jgi:hypothetical protein